MKNNEDTFEVGDSTLKMLKKYGLNVLKYPLTVGEVIIDQGNRGKGLHLYKVICPMNGCDGTLLRIEKGEVRCTSEKCRFESTITKTFGPIGETMFTEDARRPIDKNER